MRSPIIAVIFVALLICLAPTMFGAYPEYEINPAVMRRCCPTKIIETVDGNRKAVDVLIVWYEWENPSIVKEDDKLTKNAFSGFHYELADGNRINAKTSEKKSE